MEKDTLDNIKRLTDSKDQWYDVHGDNPVKFVELGQEIIIIEELGNKRAEKVLDITWGHSFFDGYFIKVTTTNDRYYFLQSYGGKITHPRFS